MSVFDNEVKPKREGKSPQSGNNCDIFEPSVYTPDESKYRIDYIKKITAKITAELDAALAMEEAPDDENPSFELEVSGRNPEKHLKFTAKYLRGPRGFNGSIDNFVVLTEAEYERLRVKDPNKFYYTYEGIENPGYVENNILYVNDIIDNTIMFSSSQIDNNILIM